MYPLLYQLYPSSAITFSDLLNFFPQRVLVCAFSVVAQLVPAPCKVSTARANGSFILKGPSGWMPAA
jgi:hypothetical protein